MTAQIHPIFAQMAECTARNDLDGLMDLYHPEAEWSRFQGILKGRDEIRAVNEKYWALGVEFVSMDEYIDSGDTIMTRSTMRIDGREEVAFGAYVLKDGKLWRIFGAVEGGAVAFW
ncbi:nuclear transport factor 2 family protein [Actinokineospora iranica]|uniref:SnoaL-like domain-containing protein n=1 Tax=Actinokineospora iranica TaxID=1271860 RepID=A0A1G6W8K1_9PSEU|nr:nuclear transport factor 2 family protein [Actinokineospora iranica]SDD62192.1 SnoaL-like domain-containing protein [Actinokineospora iranica]